ncbi:hypothetical protein EYB45_01285 [Erythrobacteraceae bacterium CFH 75059]|nr:hypothetical protein EYB45_01285 [Erythrobacteraceae bacterium CFH 75059]
MLGGCTAAATQTPPVLSPPVPAAAAPAAPGIRVLDGAALEQLKANAGVTLQWISWRQRGHAFVRAEDGQMRLSAVQGEVDGPGQLTLEGRVTEIGRDYFVFAGQIAISDVPDRGRRCVATRDNWRFAVTQNRPYWRLRDFEWCDGLTDYIDIYHPGTRP